MPLNAVRTVHTAFAWLDLVLGLPLNGLAVWAIRRHTHPTMRVYSKVVVQDSRSLASQPNEFSLFLFFAQTDPAADLRDGPAAAGHRCADGPGRWDCK
jgi:hypothetical protein